MQLSEKTINEIIFVNSTNQIRILNLFKAKKCPQELKNLLLDIVAIWICNDDEEVKKEFCQEWLSSMELPDEVPEITLDEFIASCQSLLQQNFSETYKTEIENILSKIAIATENHEKRNLFFSRHESRVLPDSVSCASSSRLSH